MVDYLFTSSRLGFRNWKSDDIAPFAEICADPKVMEFFPFLQSLEETTEMVKRLQDKFAIDQTTFFAVELLENKEFIGFIGMLYQKNKCAFAPPPALEIGWRLKKAAWNKGYATEGALQCLSYCKNTLNQPIVYSIAPIPNVRSERIMQKIGMHKIGEFNNPRVEKGNWLERHVIYKIDLSTNQNSI